MEHDGRDRCRREQAGRHDPQSVAPSVGEQQRSHDRGDERESPWPRKVPIEELDRVRDLRQRQLRADVVGSGLTGRLDQPRIQRDERHHRQHDVRKRSQRAARAVDGVGAGQRPEPDDQHRAHQRRSERDVGGRTHEEQCASHRQAPPPRWFGEPLVEQPERYHHSPETEELGKSSPCGALSGRARGGDENGEGDGRPAQFAATEHPVHGRARRERADGADETDRDPSAEQRSSPTSGSAARPAGTRWSTSGRDCPATRDRTPTSCRSRRSRARRRA